MIKQENVYHQRPSGRERILGQADIYQRDSYGRYPILSGKEAPGRCFYCGEVIRGKSGRPLQTRRYCSKAHREAYLTEYSLAAYWPHTSQVCIQRASRNGRRFCERCGKKTFPGEVHHQLPLYGNRQTWHLLNRIENLIFVCHICHLKFHAEDRQNRQNAQD